MRIQLRWRPDFSAVRKRWNYFLLCFKSLTFNTYSSASDVVFEPIITIVDFTARWFGFVFVTLVIVLTSYVVVAYYMVAIPFLRENYWLPRAYLTIAYGHYLLVMIVFHYYKAVTTDPGRPPKEASELAVTSVCKKCILPKPPRTHHCSVCRNCVLKMDHHCPWLNGCVGHFNHRYFISFCIFMWLGTFFVVTSTWPLFSDCFNVPDKVKFTVDSVYGYFGKGEKDNDSLIPKNFMEENPFPEENQDMKQGKVDTFSHLFNFEVVDEEELKLSEKVDLCEGKGRSFKNNVVFLWILCGGVTAALGTLTAVQIRLISRGETSIEKLINDKERRKSKKTGASFMNPYDFGSIKNWMILLGFNDFRTFFMKVLLPQGSLPRGNGLAWDIHINKNI